MLGTSLIAAESTNHAARSGVSTHVEPSPTPPEPNGSLELVAFAAGCFWHVEETFRTARGVHATQAGYAAGPPGVAAEATPCRRDTGHVEAVRVWFDPAVTTLEQLIEVFWGRHDPAARHRVQGGPDYRYRSAIFTTTDAQHETAQRAVEAQRAVRGPDAEVTTTVHRDAPFQPASDANQRYLHRQRSRRPTPRL